MIDMNIVKYFKFLHEFNKRKKILTEIYEQENILDNLSNLIGAKFKIDRAGRIYGVFNPFVKNGKFNYDEVIYEYNVAGMAFDSYIEKVLMDKLNIANKFIVNHQIFDLVTYNIERLDEQGNYLFTITPLYFDEMLKDRKKTFAIWTPIIIVILIILGIILL